MGIGFVAIYFAYGQNKALYESYDGNLHELADVLHQSIKSLMLPGEAPLVVSLFNDIQAINPMHDISMYRQNGVVAFSDDSTIDTVNRNLGRIRFRPKAAMLKGDPMSTDNANFIRALEAGCGRYRHRCLYLVIALQPSTHPHAQRTGRSRFD